MFDVKKCIGKYSFFHYSLKEFVYKIWCYFSLKCLVKLISKAIEGFSVGRIQITYSVSLADRHYSDFLFFLVLLLEVVIFKAFSHFI